MLVTFAAEINNYCDMKQRVSTVKAEFSSEKVTVKEQRINKAKGLKICKKLNKNWQSV
jgi:hypothetical protein